jgi:WD40 repeat protein
MNDIKIILKIIQNGVYMKNKIKKITLLVALLGSLHLKTAQIAQAQTRAAGNATFVSALALSVLCFGKNISRLVKTAFKRQNVHAAPATGVVDESQAAQPFSVDYERAVRIAKPLILKSGCNSVDCLATSSKGVIVAGLADHTVRVWNLALSDSELAVLSGHQGTIISIAFLQDDRIVTGSWDGTVRVWDLTIPHGQVGHMVTLRGHTGRVSSLAVLSHDRIASGSGDGTIRVWNLADQSEQPLVLRGNTREVYSVAALSSDKVVFGSGDCTVRVWDTTLPEDHPEYVTIIGKHDQAVTDVAVLPQGIIVSGSCSNWSFQDPDDEPNEADDRFYRNQQYSFRMFAWDLTKSRGEKGYQTQLGQSGKPVFALATLPDGRLFVRSNAHTLDVWNLASLNENQGNIVPSKSLKRLPGELTNMAILPDDRVLLVSPDGKNIVVWPSKKYLENKAAKTQHPGDYQVDGPAVYKMLFGPQFEQAAALDKPIVLQVGSEPVTCLSASLDGRLFTAGSDVGATLLLDESGQAFSCEQHGKKSQKKCLIAMAPEGHVVKIDHNGIVRFWNSNDALQGKLAEHCIEYKQRAKSVTSVAVFSDGRFVTGSRDGHIYIWNPASPDCNPVLLAKYKGSVSSITISVDGCILATSTDGWVRVWRPEPSNPTKFVLDYEKTLSYGQPNNENTKLTSSAFFSDGSFVTGSQGGIVRTYNHKVFNFSSHIYFGRIEWAQNELPYRAKHKKCVTCLGVLPGGRTVSGSRDGTVRIWDPVLPVVLKCSSEVTSLTVFPDGRIAAGCADGTVNIWKTEEYFMKKAQLEEAVTVFSDDVETGGGSK